MSTMSTNRGNALKMGWRALDSLLRGELRTEEQQGQLRVLLAWQWFAAALFGVSIGVYALTSRDEVMPQYLLANAVKFPLLLALTTVTTCPSLYVFGALRGLRFTALEFVGLLVVAHTILAAVLGSLGPVLAFFALTTHSYSFMVIMTVGCCSLGGALGLRWFLRAIHRHDEAQEPEPSEGITETDGPEVRFEESDEISTKGVQGKAKNSRFKEAAKRRRQTWQVLGWWLALYVFVGAQMGWVMRPFVGSPKLEFEFFRAKSGSFFEALFQHLGTLFGG